MPWGDFAAGAQASPRASIKPAKRTRPARHRPVPSAWPIPDECRALPALAPVVEPVLQLVPAVVLLAIWLLFIICRLLLDFPGSGPPAAFRGSREAGEENETGAQHYGRA